MNKKGETSPSTYIMAFIMFTFMVVGGLSYLHGFSSVDSSFTDNQQFANFNDTFNNFDALEKQVGVLQEGVVDGDESTTAVDEFIGYVNLVTGSGWTAIKTVLTSFGFITTTFLGLHLIFPGIPIWVAPIILLLLTVSIVFAIYSAAFQRKL